MKCFIWAVLCSACRLRPRKLECPSIVTTVGSAMMLGHTKLSTDTDLHEEEGALSQSV